MGKVLAEHGFSNGKRISLELLSPEEQAAAGFLPEDLLMLVFQQDEEGKRIDTQIVMRPDEALIAAKVLTEGVYKAVEGYTVKR